MFHRYLNASSCTHTRIVMEEQCENTVCQHSTYLVLNCLSRYTSNVMVPCYMSSIIGAHFLSQKTLAIDFLGEKKRLLILARLLL
jgi:hypothetical protein